MTEDARKKVHKDWRQQCEKLESAGYSTDGDKPSLERAMLVLLAQQYLIDKSKGQEYLRELALMAYSDSVTSFMKAQGKVLNQILDNRDQRLDELRWGARKTYAHNYELVEDITQFQYSNPNDPSTDPNDPSKRDESETSHTPGRVPVYKWMGVSRAFPSRNRLNESERGSEEAPEKIGTTPSLKNLWQMAGTIGVHPALLIADENMMDAVRRLFASNQDHQAAIEAARGTLKKVAEAIRRFEEAGTNDQRIDAAERWRDLTVSYAEEIGCNSPGGKLGARLGIDSEDPATLAAMTRFGHFLGKVGPEWLIQVDLFKDSDTTRSMVFGHDEESNQEG